MSIDDLPQQFKDMGPEALRTLMQNGGLNTQFQRAAVSWLSEQDTLREARSEAREAARDTKSDLALLMAKRANILAASAIIIAIIDMICGHVH